MLSIFPLSPPLSPLSAPLSPPPAAGTISMPGVLGPALAVASAIAFFVAVTASCCFCFIMLDIIFIIHL